MSCVLSAKSKDRLSQCDDRLQDVVMGVVAMINKGNIETDIKDITILCGHRGEEEQNKAYEAGHSLAMFGESKHNSFPSLAVDIAPYPIPMKDGRWDDNHQDWYDLASLMKHEAKKRKINIKWGGDFVHLKDKPHFELAD